MFNRKTLHCGCESHECLADIDRVNNSSDAPVKLALAIERLGLSAQRDRVIASGKRSEPGEIEPKTIQSLRERAKDSVARLLLLTRHLQSLCCFHSLKAISARDGSGK